VDLLHEERTGLLLLSLTQIPKRSIHEEVEAPKLFSVRGLGGKGRLEVITVLGHVERLVGV